MGDDDKDNSISFMEFFSHYRPLWEYAFYEVTHTLGDRADDTQELSLSKRSKALAIHYLSAHASDAQYRKLESEQRMRSKAQSLRLDRLESLQRSPRSPREVQRSPREVR